ncbi:tetratricopeptide repeat protein [Candidatus Methylobacter oryzae]|uniref:Tetratricopeptide repeat protein n=1 Tax=Candidatus Methylobacter oryzae TaxID=2497749 RepID=A0ABY3CAE2_9GAMM|nr:tetratricopeptide repeat protein [Candidatus Methylobacter oryzae]TRW95123.1 tetratricopeptide repeat protein [Candidatus Methylobacter oryzae]
MLKRSIIIFALLFLTAPAFAEDDPTMHQVYLAAEAGKFNEAQAMMDKVLKAHPNSAKAHFVEAELLAKQGLFSGAGVELSTAERLQPGLPFAKPEVVNSLKSRISSVSNGAPQSNTGAPSQNLPSSLTEWMPAILLILGIALIVMLIGFFSRRNANVIPANSYAGNGPGANMPVGPNGTVMGQPATGGMGSGILGNLASGAALGAGVVAGEALMHRFIDGDKHEVAEEPPRHDTSPWSAPSTSNTISDNDDMGGTDFGIADASSWDDDVASDDNDDNWT